MSNRVSANRLNARRSTGPVSFAGKMRSRHNALRHGLSVPARADQAIEQLARAIVADNCSAELLAAARKLAELEVECRRIREYRAMVINATGSESFAAQGGLASLYAKAMTTGSVERLERYERRNASGLTRAFCHYAMVEQRAHSDAT